MGSPMKVKLSELYPERPLGTPSHSRTNHGEQIIGPQPQEADGSYLLIDKKSFELYHNNIGNNVDSGYEYYSTISSMNHGGGPYNDVGEYCIVKIPYYGNVVNCPYPLEIDDEMRRIKKNYEQCVAGVLANRIAAAGYDCYCFVPRVADWPYSLIEEKSFELYHNNIGNNVDSGYEYYSTISSMNHGGGPYNDVGEHCIVEILDYGNVVNCRYPLENDEMRRIKKNYNWQGLMGPVVEQAVAGVLANRIAAAGSDANIVLGVHFMEIAIVLSLSFKLAAVSLKGNRCPNLSTWMGKIGDVLTASAIIMSLALHLPPVMAWTAAPLAFLVIAFAVAFA